MIRKFNIDDEGDYAKVFTTITNLQNYNNGNWVYHNLNNLAWKTDDNNSNTYENFLNYVTNNNDTYREQQLLGILLTLSDEDTYYNNKIDIYSIKISFNDGRVIKVII